MKRHISNGFGPEGSTIPYHLLFAPDGCYMVFNVMDNDEIAQKMKDRYTLMMSEAAALRSGYKGLTGRDIDDDGPLKAAEEAAEALRQVLKSGSQERHAHRLSARKKLIGAITSEDRPEGWTYNQVADYWKAQGIETPSLSPLRTAAAALRNDGTIKSDYGTMWLSDSLFAPESVVVTDEVASPIVAHYTGGPV